MLQKQELNLESEIAIFDELSDTGFRLLKLIEYLLEQDSTYNISRMGMAEEWKKLKGKPSSRKFIRGWNELKELGYIYKYGIRQGGVDGFGCCWGVRTYKEAKEWRESKKVDKSIEEENLPIVHNEEVREEECSNLNSDKTKTIKTKKIKTNSLSDDIKKIFNSYLTGNNTRKVRIKDIKFNTQRIVEAKEITERFKECEAKGIIDEVLENVKSKICKYSNRIKYKTSYITATLFNMVKEYQEAQIVEDRQILGINCDVKKCKETKYSFANTRFHNFEQRDTDYDSLLRQLNPSYY